MQQRMPFAAAVLMLNAANCASVLQPRARLGRESAELCAQTQSESPAAPDSGWNLDLPSALASPVA